MNLFETIFLSIAYVVIGLIIALPYCWLAGWDFYSFHAVFIFSPIFLGIWLFFLFFTGFFGVDESRKFYLNPKALFESRNDVTKGFRWFFWVWTVYCLLPILFNWAALAVAKLGYESTSSFLYTYRYDSIVWAFLAILILATVLGIANSIWEGIKKLQKRFA